ncbi:class I SAM-dependent methyltransferase [Bacteroides sp. 224]|uniref:class I SAM-dependent methyltransferase n=1 Tax=Bacteroides sp. 224 TaxID=2302936 RepID=UPI0013D1F8A9|nr:class I SAM-dependent methyltransferase [Bacteroides sp. 224]NDV66650.1 class I SAM-dependent methyltransferase [Bacteroides sp. 224]
MNTDYKVGDLIYDANIYDGLNTFLSDLQFYKKWLPKNKDAKILELCCGTGRLTIPIAQDGYNICGVDYTPSMLEQAETKASKAGLEINFIEADIRTLNLQEKFDLIFIPFNSIHHLYKNEDLFKAFNTVRNHLKDGGLFLLDCFNPNIQYVVEAEKEQKEIAAYTTADGREVLIKQTIRYENKTQINRIEWHYFINGQFHSVQNLDMRLFFPQELDSYLKWAGFSTIHKFGGFQEEVFEDKSEKQIYVLKLLTKTELLTELQF